MTVHPVRSVHGLSTHPQQRPDSTAPPSAEPQQRGSGDAATAYDSTWTETRDEVPAASSGFEQTMVSGGKIYVVLAVVLIIWFGLVVFLFRTDRKIARLERRIDETVENDAE
jgi:CcmD family protein